MDDYERHQALLTTIKRELFDDNAAALARAIKKNSSYVHRLFYPQGKNGAKGIGQELMKACREAFSLPNGFWDMTPEDAEAALASRGNSSTALAVRPSRVGHTIAEPVATPYLPGFETLSVPLLATAASMGPGVDQHDDVVIGRLTLRPEWVTKVLTSLSKPDNLRFIHGYGDSMEPTFQDGDILLVDTGVPAVKVDGIYVLEANERLYIKRVRQRLDGTFEISSDNPTVKTVDVLNGSHLVTVKGRVVWVWNGKKM